MNVRGKLDDTLAAYLAEFGPDGYNRESFMDYVVAHVLDPGDAPKMIAWYRQHADALEGTMRAVVRDPCSECGEAPATVERNGAPMCALCAAAQ